MPQGAPPPSPTDEEKAAIALAAQAFEDLCAARHAIGVQEYGQYTFLGNDTLRMAVEEVADLRNYATMTGIKLILIMSALEDTDTLLSEPFKGTKDGWGR